MLNKQRQTLNKKHKGVGNPDTHKAYLGDHLKGGVTNR